jgi:hypothetical protein
MNDCPYPDSPHSIAITSGQQKALSELVHDSAAGVQSKCERCQRLDILQALIYPGNTIKGSDWGRDTSYESFIKLTSWLNLGPAGSAIFWTDCSLCRLMFALTGKPEMELKSSYLRRLGRTTHLPQNSVRDLKGENIQHVHTPPSSLANIHGIILDVWTGIGAPGRLARLQC